MSAESQGAGFRDHFSGHAGDYARHRPRYPEALFDWLASVAPGRALAWDAGTGSGQAAVALAGRFDRVVATDPSAEQVRNAAPHPRVEYRVEPAEAPDLPEARVDLVTVAQALHWFDLPRFFAAAARVLRPGGVLGAWCYETMTVSPEVDRVVDGLYRGALGPYWPPERRMVEDGYRSIELPFAHVDSPPFRMEQRWTLAEVEGYLRTWSAVRRCAAATGNDPVAAVAGQLRAAWGDPGEARTVHWPLGMRVGRKAGG